MKLIVTLLSLYVIDVWGIDKNFYYNIWKLTPSQIDMLKKGEILVKSEVSDDGKVQTFKMKFAANSKKSCKRTLSQISNFQNLKEWVDYITYVNYSEKYELLTIKANHFLLPFPMIVHVKTKRPKKQGQYDFIFPSGIFKGLKGFYSITEVDKKCIVIGKSKWTGAKTIIPSTIIKIFSSTLTELAGKKILRNIK